MAIRETTLRNWMRWREKIEKKIIGPVRDLNPGPLAPKARIIPLDQQAVDEGTAKFSDMIPQMMRSSHAKFIRSIRVIPNRHPLVSHLPFILSITP